MGVLRRNGKDRRAVASVSNGSFGDCEGSMPATQERRIAPMERAERTQGTRLQRFVQDFARYGNDNLQPGSVEELAQSKRRTWEMFVRWLMLGGLLFALILIAVLAFVYSGYP
jgi:hypothetical protein